MSENDCAYFFHVDGELRARVRSKDGKCREYRGLHFESVSLVPAPRCGAEGCDGAAEGSCCACEGKFCHAHLHRATGAEGEPHDRCFDCCEPPDREW